MNGHLTFGEWLEDLYLRRYGGQQEFADEIGVGQSTVSSWVNHKQPPGRRNRLAIARALDRDIEEVNRRIKAQHWLRPNAKEGSPLSRTPLNVDRDEIMFPITAILPADLARGIWQEGEHGVVPVSRSYLGGRSLDDVFAARISGDCLAALMIADNDVVLCEWAKGRRPEDGDMVVVAVDGEATVKLWFWVEGGVELRDGDGRVVYRGKPGIHLHVEGYVLKVIRDVRT